MPGRIEYRKALGNEDRQQPIDDPTQCPVSLGLSVRVVILKPCSTQGLGPRDALRLGPGTRHPRTNQQRPAVHGSLR